MRSSLRELPFRIQLWGKLGMSVKNMALENKGLQFTELKKGDGSKKIHVYIEFHNARLAFLLHSLLCETRKVTSVTTMTPLA